MKNHFLCDVGCVVCDPFEMLRDALDAFVQGEPTRAEQVLVRDDSVDELYGRAHSGDDRVHVPAPGQVAEAIRVIHVAKYLKGSQTTQPISQRK